MAKSINHLGEREFSNYKSWKAAVRAIDFEAKWDGDKDICSAFTEDGVVPIGEWDGSVGVIYKDAKERVDQHYTPALKPIAKALTDAVPPLSEDFTERTVDAAHRAASTLSIPTPLRR
jgi:hypothetical protein